MPSGFDSRPPPTTPGLPSPGSSGLLPPVRVHAGAMPTPSNMPGGSREGSPPPTAVGPASPVSPPPHVAEALLRLEQEHLAAEELLRDSFARRRSGVERGVIVHGAAEWQRQLAADSAARSADDLRASSKEDEPTGDRAAPRHPSSIDH